MVDKNKRRKNVGSILQNYYNLGNTVNEKPKSEKENEPEKNDKDNNITTKNVTVKAGIRNARVTKKQNGDIENKLSERNRRLNFPLNTKEECPMDRKEEKEKEKDGKINTIDERRNKYVERKEAGFSTDLNSIKEMKTLMKEVNELDKKSSEFNANSYFKKLLETSSLEDLIKKSKMIEKEIKQNDSFMQSVVYENYNKFIEAADTITNLKGHFKEVKEQIEVVDYWVQNIDASSMMINKEISTNFEKIENLLEIKVLLKDINKIMKIPQKMYSNVLQKEYIKSLKLFIEAIPFLEKNKNIRVFQNLYLDCKNLANITCHFFLKKLNEEKNVREMPQRKNFKYVDPYKKKESTKRIGKGKKTHIEHRLNTDTDKENFQKSFLFGTSIKEAFDLLHSFVLPTDEIISCINLILTYGKDKKRIRNLYIQNRLNALKYLFYHIFNVTNYQQYYNHSFKCNILFSDHEKENEKMKEMPYSDNLFDNIFELAYNHLLTFFFDVIENYEKTFLSNCKDSEMKKGVFPCGIKDIAEKKENKEKNMNNVNNVNNVNNLNDEDSVNNVNSVTNVNSVNSLKDLMSNINKKIEETQSEEMKKTYKSRRDRKSVV